MKVKYCFIISIFSFSFLSLYFLETIFAIDQEEKNVSYYPNDIIFKEYIDNKYSFTIMYRYESDRNNPLISVDRAYQVAFSLPLIKPYDNFPPIVYIQISDLNELKNLYQNQGIEKDLDEIARGFHPNDTTKHIVLNYNLLNSSFLQLDDYFFSVYELSYLPPMPQAQQIIEKDVQTSINDKFIKLILLSEPSDYHLYEKVFDSMIKTFKLNNDSDT